MLKYSCDTVHSSFFFVGVMVSSNISNVTASFLQECVLNCHSFLQSFREGAVQRGAATHGFVSFWPLLFSDAARVR